MYKFTIVALGKLKEKAYKDLESEFLKRLSPFAKTKVMELPEEPYHKGQDLQRVKEKEAERIIKALPNNGIVILLEEKGTLRNSVEFSKFIERAGGIGKELVFVLGSGIGLSPLLKQYSNYTISLSELTFPHNMARIILEEQLYRSCTILTQKEYHK